MRSRKMLFANGMLVFSCMLAGGLSSVALGQIVGPPRSFFLQLLVGAAPGVMLSLCLALGVILINHKHSAALNRGETPGWSGVLKIAVAVGCLAVVLITAVRGVALVNLQISRTFIVAPLPAYALFPGVLTYAVLFLAVYHARWTRLSFLWFIGLIFCGIASGMVWGACHFFVVQDTVDKPAEMAMLMTNNKVLQLIWFAPLFKGLPFAFFWGLAVQWFNPAHTLERWQGLKEASQDVEQS